MPHASANRTDARRASDGAPGNLSALHKGLPAALAATTLVAVVEASARYIASPDRISASQLCLAVFANVAILGCLPLLLALAAYAVRFAARRAGAGTKRALEVAPTALPVVGAGLVSAFVTGSLLAGSGTLAAASLLPLIPEKLRRATEAATHPSKGRAWASRWFIVIMWFGSAAITLFSAGRTQDALSQWREPDFPATRVQPPNGAPNIFVVVLDTFRADRLGIVSGGDLTPHLDRFARSSLLYTNAVSTAPWTLPTHASLFTGLYPQQHGVNWGHYALSETPPTAGELLAARGYDTFALSNNWLLDEENGFARGFDAFLETSKSAALQPWRLALRQTAVELIAPWFGLTPAAGYDKGGAWTNAIVENRLRAQVEAGRPFFAFINYYEPHDPYQPPDRFLKRHLSGKQREQARKINQGRDRLSAHACGAPGVYDDHDIELMEALYDAEIAYQDEVFGRLAQSLARMGLFRNTWIIVTSDHGELFGEQGMVFHTAGAHANLLRVPLMIRPPGGVETHAKIDAPVQPVDLFRLIVEAGGAAVPEDATQAHAVPLSPEERPTRQFTISQTHGASLSGLAAAQYVSLQTDFTQWMTWITTVIEGDDLLELSGDRPRGLFDLASDPRMETNLLDDKPARAAQLAETVRTWKTSLSIDGGEG